MDQLINMDQVKVASPESMMKTTEDLKKRIDAALATLSETKREILKLRYGVEDKRFRAPEEVAEHLGMDLDEVVRLEKEALREMRHPDTEV